MWQFFPKNSKNYQTLWESFDQYSICQKIPFLRGNTFQTSHLWCEDVQHKDQRILVHMMEFVIPFFWLQMMSYFSWHHTLKFCPVQLVLLLIFLYDYFESHSHLFSIRFPKSIISSPFLITNHGNFAHTYFTVMTNIVIS